MSRKIRKLLQEMSDKLQLPDQSKRYVSFNTHVMQTPSGAFVKISVPLDLAERFPICSLLTPSELRKQFSETEHGLEKFDKIKEAMQIQERAIKKDEKYKKLYYRLFGYNFKGKNGIKELPEYNRYEIKKIEIDYDELYLCNIITFGRTIWESHFLTSLMLWHEHEEESFHEFILDRSENSETRLDLYNLEKTFRSIKLFKIMTQKYIYAILNPFTSKIAEASDPKLSWDSIIQKFPEIFEPLE